MKVASTISNHKTGLSNDNDNSAGVSRNIELIKFSCQTCGINIFINGTASFTHCPYCNNLFEMHSFLKPVAENFSPPAEKEVQEKINDLYNALPPFLGNLVLFSSIFLLIIAAVMHIQSVDNYILQPLIISLYSLSVLTFVMSRFVIAAFYKAPQENEQKATLSVLVPCMNEETVIRRTIETIFAAGYRDDKLEVICVNDGSSDNTLDKMLDSLTRHPNLVVVDFIANKGLCNGWAVSTLIAQGEIMVCVDSDTFILPGSLNKLVQGFADPAVGGVSGHCDIENAQTNILTKMQDVRYFFSYKIMKAAESVSGSVSCLPGCFSAYRRVCVLHVLDEWINSKVMGVSGNFADDRSLTNLILRDYKIIYDNRALATTLAPEHWSVYVRQQARWNRSYLREIIKTSRWIWKKPPGAALAWLTMMWLPLIEPIVLIMALVVTPIVVYFQDGIVYFPLSYLAGLLVITGAWSLDYYTSTGRKNWWAGFLYTLTYLLFFSWQVYWSFLTLTTKKWGTRSVESKSGNQLEVDGQIPENKLEAKITHGREWKSIEVKDGWVKPLALPRFKYVKKWLLALSVSFSVLSLLIPGVIYYGKMLPIPPEDREWSVRAFREEVFDIHVLKPINHSGNTLKALSVKTNEGKKVPIDITYHKLKLGIGSVQLPIVHGNTKADVELFFNKLERSEKKGAKKAALALAQGYLTLLYLSKIDEIPLTNVEQLQVLDEVIAALGPNSLLASCTQESFYTLADQDGYFQLAVEPVEIPGGEWIDSGKGFWAYGKFLENVSKKATITGKSAKHSKSLSDEAYQPDITAFCCSAILKGYYDAGTWISLTENDYYTSIHKKVNKLIVNYAMNKNNNRTVAIKVPGQATQNYFYPASQILVRLFAWSFNRGRFTDTEQWSKSKWTFHINSFFKKFSDGKTAIEDVVHYIPYTTEQHDLRYPWGARYIYQIPAIARELDNFAEKTMATRYTAQISLQDMIDYLNILSPLYPADALETGIQTAGKLFKNQSYAYDSEQFFTIFYAITSAVIEASKH